jgi:hypothetical protein
VELEDEARRAVLLERLHLLEAAAQGHGQDVVLAADVLHPLHDAAGQTLLLEADVHQVLDHRDRDAPLLLHDAERELLGRVHDHAHEVSRHERAHVDVGDVHFAHEEHARGRPPLGPHTQQRPQQARYPVDRHEPLVALEERGR